MRPPLTTRRHATRFILTAAQHATIENIAKTPDPAKTLGTDRQHSFRLRVSRVLNMSAMPTGQVSDALVTIACNVALAEVEGMR